MKEKSLDQQYAELLEDIKVNGSIKGAARPNLPFTNSVFTRMISIKDGSLPILKGKKVAFKQVLVELLWFLSGNTNIKYLVDNNCNIWNNDAYRYYKELGGLVDFDTWLQGVKEGKECCFGENSEDLRYYTYGDCDKIYGFQWRRFCDKTDQIKNLIQSLKETPNSRYNLVTSYNPKDREEKSLALAPCHIMFFCNVRSNKVIDEKYLDLTYVQRSVDTPLGLPFNLLSYGILQRILCEILGYKVGEFNAVLMDCHYYENQTDYVSEYIRRFKEGEIPENKDVDLIIDSSKWEGNIDNIKLEDFKLMNYSPLTSIKAPLSVGL